MTAKPVSVSVAADRQSRADLGSIYGQLLDKKSTSLAGLFLILTFFALQNQIILHLPYEEVVLRCLSHQFICHVLGRE